MKTVATTQCETVDHLDFDHCKPDQLPISELKTLCQLVGLNVERDVFPVLLARKKTTEQVEPTRADYVAAAYECILIAEETDSHTLLNEVLQESPDMLAEIVTDLLKQHPGLVEGLVRELKRHDPRLFASINEHDLIEGRQSILERPELAQHVIKELVDLHPSLFRDLENEL
jgi:hypothetical protein